MRCCRYVVDSMLFAGKILHSLGLGLRGRVSRRAGVGGGVKGAIGLFRLPSHLSSQRTPAGDPGCGYTPACGRAVGSVLV